ncbi:hypothetical protein [Motiliproteus sp. MSK22-1]|uniref:hypothetical protein n=1 Tax=Motiliproteus sp. MSK22-1 TaxID=1897630 RepID=UPI00117C4388|nr:hypothetical protein [Motiliproteus sp. MSK22-1]
MTESGIIAAIQSYISEKKTGTIMAVFEGNNLARMYLVNGAIATIRYGEKEGQAALDMCKSLDPSSVKFYDNLDLVYSEDLLIPADELNQPESAPVEVDSSISNDEQADSSEDPIPVVTERLLTDDDRQKLSELLSEYVGPISVLLISDLREDIGLEAAIEAIANEMDDSDKTAEFAAAARKIVQPEEMINPAFKLWS